MKPCTEGSNPSLSAIRGARLAAALAVVTATSLTGCVERYLKIDTDPPGARVYVNGEDKGLAPVEMKFVHYGTMRVDAWLETSIDRRPGVTQQVELDAPWYESFPLDLFAELFDPVTHVDRHEVTLAIPATASATTAEAREVELRRRAEELRAETR